MSKVTVFVGLDYHKASIQVCVMDTSGQILANRPCTNQAEALVKLVAPFGHDVRAAIEACPGAANLADELATRAASATSPDTLAGKLIALRQVFDADLAANLAADQLVVPRQHLDGHAMLLQGVNC